MESQTNFKSNDFQTFQYQDNITILKSIKETKDLLFM